MATDTEDVLKKLVELITGASQATETYAKTSKLLKDAQQDLFKAQENLKNGLDKDGKAYKAAKDAVSALLKTQGEEKVLLSELRKEQEFAIAAKFRDSTATGKLNEATAKLNDILRKQQAIFQNTQKLTSAQFKERQNAQKQVREQQKIQEKWNLELIKSGSGTERLKVFQENLSKSVSTVTSSLTSLIGKLGLTAISFAGITKEGRDYNAEVFALSRTQTIAGKTGGFLTATLDKAAASTNLSAVQFAKFGNALTRGFLGVKPTLNEIAELSKMLTSVGIVGAEQQIQAGQDLKSMQAQFPSLYEKQAEAMKLVKKISEQGGGEAEKAQLEAIRENIQATQMRMGVSREMQEKYLSMTHLMTESEKKLMELSQERQKAEQALGNAQKELFKQLEPLLIGATKALTTIVSKVVEFKEAFGAIFIGIGVFAGLTKGIMATQAAAAALKIAFGAMGGPIGWAIIAISALATGIGYVYGKQKKQNEAAKEGAKIAQLQGEIERDKAEYTDKQMEAYEKATAEAMKTAKTSDEIKEAHLKGKAAVEGEIKASKDLGGQMQKIMQDTKMRVDLQRKLTEAYRDEAAWLSEVGIISKRALVDTFKSAVQEVERLEKGISDMASIIQSGLQEVDIDVNFNMDDSGEVKVKKLRDAIRDLAENDPRRAKFQEQINQLVEKESEKRQTAKAIQKDRLNIDLAEFRQMQQGNTVYSERLNMERELYESAQFGMGASLTLMQKQVDMQYAMIDAGKKSAQNLIERIASEQNLDALMVKDLFNSKDKAVVQQKLTALGITDAETQRTIAEYADQYQVVTTKTMESQKKIYELTKGMREGYLQAIQAMTVGAGEFEKILGTQTMGVTQLMDTVDSAGERGRLNTMGLGGRGIAKSRKTPGAEYGADGVGVKINTSKEGQDEQNSELHGYRESVRDATYQSGPKIPASATQTTKFEANMGPQIAQAADKEIAAGNENTKDIVRAIKDLDFDRNLKYDRDAGRHGTNEVPDHRAANVVVRYLGTSAANAPAPASPLMAPRSGGQTSNPSVVTLPSSGTGIAASNNVSTTEDGAPFPKTEERSRVEESLERKRKQREELQRQVQSETEKQKKQTEEADTYFQSFGKESRRFITPIWSTLRDSIGDLGNRKVGAKREEGGQDFLDRYWEHDRALKTKRAPKQSELEETARKKAQVGALDEEIKKEESESQSLMAREKREADRMAALAEVAAEEKAASEKAQRVADQNKANEINRTVAEDFNRTRKGDAEKSGRRVVRGGLTPKELEEARRRAISESPSFKGSSIEEQNAFYEKQYGGGSVAAQAGSMPVQSASVGIAQNIINQMDPKKLEELRNPKTGINNQRNVYREMLVGQGEEAYGKGRENPNNLWKAADLIANSTMGKSAVPAGAKPPIVQGENGARSQANTSAFNRQFGSGDSNAQTEAWASGNNLGGAISEGSGGGAGVAGGPINVTIVVEADGNLKAFVKEVSTSR